MALTAEQQAMVDAVQAELDAEKQKGAKKAPTGPVSKMDRFNDLTSSIQSMANPALRLMSHAERGTTGTDYFQGVLRNQQESAERGSQARQNWPGLLQPGELNVGDAVGEITGALALTKGQGMAPTMGGRLVQATATGTALGPAFSDGDTLSAMNQGAKWGMITGPAFEGLRKGIEIGGPFLRKIFSKPETRAGHMLNNVLGDKVDDVKDALRNTKSRVPGEKLTAGETASSAKSPQMSTLQKIVDEVDPAKYNDINSANKAARIAAIKGQGGDAAKLEAARNTATRPLREGALDRADIGSTQTRRLGGKFAQERQSQVNAMQDQGRFATTAAQQQNLSVGGRAPSGNLSPSAYPVQGQPRVPARYTENAQRVPEALSASDDATAIAAARRGQANLTKYQLDSLAAHSHYPLKSEGVIGAIDKRLGNKIIPTMERKALSAVKENILSRTDADGTIQSNALYTVRKEIGNTLESIFKQEGITWDKALSGRAQRTIQKIIDESIEGAGGSGWNDYLRAYVEKSAPIANAELGNVYTKSLSGPFGKETPNKFARTVDKTPPQNQKLAVETDAVMESLQRNSDLKQLAAKGAPSTREAINMEVPRLPNTGMFSPNYQVFKSVMNRFSDRATKNVMKELANSFDDPAKVLELLNKTDIPGPWQETLIALSKQASLATTSALEGQYSSSRIHPH